MPFTYPEGLENPKKEHFSEICSNCDFAETRNDELFCTKHNVEVAHIDNCDDFEITVKTAPTVKSSEEEREKYVEKINKNADVQNTEKVSDLQICSSTHYGFCEECSEEGNCQKQKKYSRAYFADIENEHLNAKARNLNKLKLDDHYNISLLLF